MLGALCPDYEVFLNTQIPESFFKPRGGSFHYRCQPVDTGCVQASFVAVDHDASFSRLEDFYRNADRRMESESDWLAENAIDLVISDVPSWPLHAAAGLHLPGLLVANFTWHDIYSHFPGASSHAALLDRLRSEYAAATIQFLPQLHLTNDVTQNQQEVGLLALPGVDLRERLQARLAVPFHNRTLAFIYAGQYDTTVMQWDRLAALRDCVFLTRDPLPAGPLPDNLVVLDDGFAHPDLMASADLVITKGGYSTLATAFHHGKPVLSCDRPDFEEFEAVRACLHEKQIGVVLDSGRFLQGDWWAAIKKAREMTVKGKMRLNGERDIRAAIDRLLKTQSTLSG